MSRMRPVRALLLQFLAIAVELGIKSSSVRHQFPTEEDFGELQACAGA
jgi:hypothetical protein